MRTQAQRDAYAALLPDTNLDLIAESRVNPDLVGLRFIHWAPERVQGPDYDWGPGGSEMVGEYVRSIKTTEGEHWIELRLVEQGPWTGAALGSVYSLRASRVKEVGAPRRAPELEGR